MIKITGKILLCFLFFWLIVLFIAFSICASSAFINWDISLVINTLPNIDYLKVIRVISVVLVVPSIFTGLMIEDNKND